MTTSNAITTWDDSDTLDDIVSLAWTTFVGSTLVRFDADDVEPDVVCASIAICGPQEATVLFFADPGLARASSSAVLGIDPAAATDPEIHDVMGELVNIIGGNLKGLIGLVDGEWSLSLPLVSNAMQTAPAGRLVSQVSFVTDGGTIGCQILQHG